MGSLPRYAIVTFLAVVLVIATCRAETLRLRADPWMPFNGEPGAKYPGYVIEIAEAVFGDAGIAIDYRNQPWGAALAACAAGEIDGVIGANTVEAAQLIVPHLDIGSPRVGYFTLKSNPWRYENLSSLTRVRVGVIADYKYYDALDAYVGKHQEPQIVRFAGDHPLKDAIEKLVAGDIDVFVEVYPVFAWNARAAGYKPEQFRLAYLHEAEPVYIAFAPGEKGRKHAEIFDRGLQQLRQSGRLAALLKRYGQDDWAP